MSDSSQGLPPPPVQVAPPKKRASGAITAVVVIVAIGVFGCAGVGVLAAIAIPAFLNYTKRAKVAEATTNLRTMAELTIALCEAEHRMPSNARPTPSTPTNARQIAIFDDAGFRDIHFEPPGPTYFSHSITNRPDGTVQLLAEGDLDGDGTRSSHRIICGPSCTCDALVSNDSLE